MFVYVFFYLAILQCIVAYNVNSRGTSFRIRSAFRAPSLQLGAQYGSDRRYVGENVVTASRSRVSRNLMSKISKIKNLFVSIISFIPCFISKLLKWKVWVKKAPQTYDKNAPSESSNVIMAAVQSDISDSISASKKSVEKTLQEIEQNEFANKLAKANLMAEKSLEAERNAAIALAKNLNYKTSTKTDSVENSDSESIPDFNFSDFFSGESISKNKIKEKGTSGVVSYIATELMFWAISFPIIIASYHTSTGDWLNIADDADKAKIFTYSAGFLTTARLLVPARLGLALALSPFVEKYTRKG